jgi:hypothetical protein
MRRNAPQCSALQPRERNVQNEANVNLGDLQLGRMHQNPRFEPKLGSYENAKRTQMPKWQLKRGGVKQ